MALTGFTRKMVGGVFLGPINRDSVPTNASDTSDFMTEFSSAKKVEMNEYYDGLCVSFGGKSYYLCDPGTQADPYWQETLGSLGECLHECEIETLVFDSRFKSELNWTWMTTRPRNLKHLVIPFLGNMSPTITNGIESLNLTEAGEEWYPIEEEEFAIKYNQPELLGLEQPYAGIERVIFGTTRDELNGEEMSLLRSRFPKSAFELDNTGYKCDPEAWMKTTTNIAAKACANRVC
jgi:hypothetical protein